MWGVFECGLKAMAQPCCFTVLQYTLQVSCTLPDLTHKSSNTHSRGCCAQPQWCGSSSNVVQTFDVHAHKSTEHMHFSRSDTGMHMSCRPSACACSLSTPLVVLHHAMHSCITLCTACITLCTAASRYAQPASRYAQPASRYAQPALRYAQPASRYAELHHAMHSCLAGKCDAVKLHC